MLKLYNSLTRKKEPFKPIKKGNVRLYTCGPTVYSYAHIGNFRAYIFADLLKRYLIYSGYKVKHVMNITDIDDKTIKRSGEQGISLKEFTEKYIEEFFKDIDTLNIQRASIYPKATEHIQDMIKLTKALVKKGYAYEKLHSVYYAISKFKAYGKLSKVDLSQMKAGARVDLDEYEKAHPGDFTLMKRSKLDELKRGIYYKTEWGNVRPGWHIECSAMSMKYLGKTFDIHTGGIDLIFPHHENEIAQSEAYTGKKFVNYWLHNEHLIVNGKKMSKSSGNFYTLKDLLKKDYDPIAIRYVLLSTHYRQQLNFTFKDLEAAKNTIDKLKDFMQRLQEMDSDKKNPDILNLTLKAKTEFERAMDNDLRISSALAAIFNFVKEINKIKELSKKDAELVYDQMLKFDSVLGLNLDKAEKKELTQEEKQLIEDRETARAEKDFTKADELRDKLKQKGIILEDTKEGVRWKKS